MGYTRAMKIPTAPESPAEPLFLGGHPALDFLNTLFGPDDRQVETIGSGRAFLDWLVAASLLDETVSARLPRRFGEEALDGAAAEARKFREWARTWLMRWRAAPHRDYSSELSALNKMLARESCHREVVAAGEGLKVTARPRLEQANALVALAAGPIAALVTEEQATLVRSCAGANCSLWFLDRTKSHRRLFCSAAVCGNRAKVQAFRVRASQSGD
jgi:predicted RNA-binding Zn ribbon-like protein